MRRNGLEEVCIGAKRASTALYAGERVGFWGAVMITSKYPPNCLLFHDIVNKLAVILGNCELARERVVSESLDSEWTKRLDAIHNAAAAVLEDVKRHRCDLESAQQIMLIERAKETANL